MIDIYSLDQRFIDIAYENTNGEFQQKIRPMLILVNILGSDYAIPIVHTTNRNYSFSLGSGSRAKFDKAFPIVNRNILHNRYRVQIMGQETFDSIEQNYDRIRDAMIKYVKFDYPTAFSVDYEILIKLQLEFK